MKKYKLRKYGPAWWCVYVLPATVMTAVFYVLACLAFSFDASALTP